MGKTKDITGKKFGKLTAISLTNERTKYGSAVWLCRCDCGNMVNVGKDNLGKSTNSCGCIAKEISKACIKQALNVKENGRIENTYISSLQQKKGINNKSGFKGVYWVKKYNKWYANIQVNNKQIWLGSFDELADAISARKKAEEIYFQPIIDKFNELHPKL